jgi:hypothetical protein
MKGISVTNVSCTPVISHILYLLAERLQFFRQLHYSCDNCTSSKTTISHCGRPFKGIKYLTIHPEKCILVADVNCTSAMSSL